VLDELAMMLLFLPILLPVIFGLDLHGLTTEYKVIWFGILMLTVIAMGLIAPPIGLNVYVVANIARTVPIGEIYRGVLPFLVWDVLRIALLLFFPAMALWVVQFVR
jgi:TRAP-type C4-dicarboxylate transport system permease large subunit